MTPQEVIKEIMAHIAMLEMNEAMDALLNGTGGDAGYVKALADVKTFIEKRVIPNNKLVEPASKEVEYHGHGGVLDE